MSKKKISNEKGDKDDGKPDMYKDPDYTSSDFILQNLSILDDLLSEPTGLMDKREAIAEEVAIQVCYYVYCVLSCLNNLEDFKRKYVREKHKHPKAVHPKERGGFWIREVLRKRKPCIMIFGPMGFLGRRITSKLRQCGCADFLFLFDRSDTTRLKRIRSIGPDVVINCANSSAFSSMTKDLITHVHPHCVFISCSYGLLRRRMYYIFKTPTVFRTYVEPVEDHRSGNAAVSAADLLYRRSGGSSNLAALLGNYFFTNGGHMNEAASTAYAVLSGQDNPRAKDTFWREDVIEAIEMLRAEIGESFFPLFMEGSTDIHNEDYESGTIKSWSAMDEAILEEDELLDIYARDFYDSGQSAILDDILAGDGEYGYQNEMLDDDTKSYDHGKQYFDDRLDYEYDQNDYGIIEDNDDLVSKGADLGPPLTALQINPKPDLK
jgi:hypothetical protein